MAFLVLMVSNAMAGEVFTYTFTGGTATSNPSGFFSYDTSGKFSFNSKFTGCEYDGQSYSNGLKMEGSTKILFTTTEVSTVTILQSNWNSGGQKTIKFDGEELALANAATCTGGLVYTIIDVAVGDHNITRGTGESGLFLVKVEYADKAKTVTFINDDNWEKVYVWAWRGDENFTGGTWPGVELTEKDLEGNYTWSTMDDPEWIIFNDGNTNQTSDLDFKDGGKYNSTGRIIELTTFTTTFKTDGMDAVWAYAWNNDGEVLGTWPGTQMVGGSGEFTLSFEAENAPSYIIFNNNAGLQTPDLAFEDGKVYEYNLNEYTATFTTDAGWSDVYAWAWNDSKNFSESWPGEKLVATDGVYSYTVKAFEGPKKILFNNGDAGKTPDLSFINGKAYKWIVANPLYALQEGETFEAGTTVEVKKGDDVVATITYGVSGEDAFNAAAALAHEDYAGFGFYTSGNGVNGSADGGTVYTIKPVYDGTITVGVRLNADKPFYIVEDDTALPEYNGIKLGETACTSFSFAVKAGSEYKVYCTGSKLGFYGFDYTFTKPEGIIPDGTYYVMNANEGTLISATSALDAKGAPITFTFNAAANAYTIEGADFFSGKQWTIADAVEGMSGFYTISTTDGFLAVSATNALEQIADGTADAAVWILLQKAYWEDIVNSTYTVAGTKNLTGTENDWEIAEANQMVLNEETGLFEKKFEGVVIDAENQPAFKVVQTNMKGEQAWYPAGGTETNWVITTEYVGGEGIYDITITFDPSDLKEIGVAAVKTGDISKNTYTATFKTNLAWESVYAYAWSGEGDATVKFLGDWPGTEVTDVDDSNDDYDIYTLTFEATTAPEKIIFSNGVGGSVGKTKTADLEFVDGQEYSLIYTPSTLMEEAMALALDDEAVAVGKLLAAIQYAFDNDDESQLQTAINQFKADNADQEKDETAKVATNGWKKFDGSAAGVCATQFAPAITTYDGREAQMAEVYETNGNRTGTIIYQDITGLTNGNYKVGFYGNAFSTSQRDGFECTMEDGATDVAYVFANEEKEYISARITTSTTENDFRTFDVEVTDGNIKLGMGKDTEKSTNWHTIQIYQLTWFTTAKEVYAADQTELAGLLTEAKALAADESKTEGKEALNAAIATAEEATADKKNWYNISEIEEIIANMKAAIANFKKANYFIDFAAGEYYVIDAESGLKMAAGHDWGTRGIVNEAGLDLTLTPYEASRTVTIDSRVSNGGNSHFLGSNLYMDSSEWGWALDYQGFGFYILNPDGGKYINIDANNNLVLSDTPREWIIVSKDGVRAQLLDEMADATKDAPVDATGLLTAPNFNRNDARNAEAWIVSEDCTNKNLSGGNNLNNCAESYHSTFTIMQTVSNAPAGFYQLTAQGFYRQDEFEGEAPAAPVFFANEINGDVPALADGGPNGMDTASEAFTNGDYTIEPITFEVKEDGMMYIGVTASTNTQWVIWDNFQLKYFGAEIPTGIKEINHETITNNGQVYNLRGQKVEKAQKGLYIVNGKVVVIK